MRKKSFALALNGLRRVLRLPCGLKGLADFQNEVEMRRQRALICNARTRSSSRFYFCLPACSFTGWQLWGTSK